MPTTYAHWRFGSDCLNQMPDNLKQAVSNHRDIFDIGVHGPDIFFYDLLHGEIGSFGYKMHFEPANKFFEQCKVVYKKYDEKQEMLAYIFGFLTHFTLDSTCHGYVDRKSEVSNISHNKVESQWDKHIMELDGKKHNEVDRAQSLKPNKENIKIIARFFPFDEKAILRTTKGQHTLIHALNCRSRFKDKFINCLLRKLGKDDFADLLLSFVDDDICRDSNLRLDKLRAKALELYPELCRNLLAYLNDEEELSPYFEHDFEPWQDYKNIPILTYQEELEYKV